MSETVATCVQRKLLPNLPGDAANHAVSRGTGGASNAEIYAYSETMFGAPTLRYVMTENWINGCCCLNEDVSDSHLGRTENGHKTVPRIRFVTRIKTLLEWVPIM